MTQTVASFSTHAMLVGFSESGQDSPVVLNQPLSLLTATALVPQSSLTRLLVSDVNSAG
ncbi:MAG: hypothetical protein V7629_18140 [Motiliproteus sp.]